MTKPISCGFKPVRANHVNFAALTLPAVDLLVENPAGKKSVAILGATRFLLHRPFLRAPEKRVKNAVLAGKNERPKMRFTLAQERERNPVGVVQFAPLQASVLGLVGVRFGAELRRYDRAVRRAVEGDQVETQAQAGHVIAQYGFKVFVRWGQRLRRQRESLDIFLSQREIDSMVSMLVGAIRLPFLPEDFSGFR